jgi:hypothetical protein
MTDDLEERERWLDQRLEQERALILKTVGQMLAERKDDRGADYLSGEIAALWRALAAAQKLIAELYQERVNRLTGADPAAATARRVN